MRRWTAVLAVLAVLAALTAACGPTAASVGHARHDSWVRIHDPAFTAGPSHSVVGIAAPSDGYRSWTAVGSVRDGPVRPAAWSSKDGTVWGRAELYLGEAREAVASAAAVRAGRVVVVGTAVTALGDRDPRIWTTTEGATWAPVPILGGPGDQSLTAVAAGPLGVVAAGTDRSGGRTVPAVWFSGDGTSWPRAEGPFGSDGAIASVAVGPSGMVAVGTVDTGGEVDGMVWFSADGTTWRTVPLGSAGFTGPARQRVRAVTATAAGGFVAVGDDGNADLPIAVVWTSVDGITWQRQPASPDMAEFVGIFSSGGVTAASVTGSGPVVAAGGGALLQIWTSPDGRRWTRDQPPGTGRGGQENAIVVTDAARSLLVLAGGALSYRPAGATWADVDGDRQVFPRPELTYAIGAMVRAGGRILAFGRADQTVLWTSDDGRRWDRWPDPTGVFAGGTVAAAATLGDVIVAVGTRPDAQGRTVAAVWTSADDGATWARTGDDNPAFSIRRITQMIGVGRGGPGLIAVGISFQDGAVNAHAWSSADGRTWRRATDPPEWGGPGNHQLSTAGALPDGTAVVMGVDIVKGETDAWAWTSRDGVTWERAVAAGAAPLAGPGNQFVNGCASTSGGVLVSGGIPGANGSEGAVWSTTDGHTWSLASPSDSDAGSGNDRLLAIAADGSRAVATALVDGDLVVYTSTDAGATWRRRDAATFGTIAFEVASEVLIAGNEVVAAGVERGERGGLDRAGALTATNRLSPAGGSRFGV